MLIKVSRTWPARQPVSTLPRQHVTSRLDLLQENENLRSRVQQLELSLQQRAEQLSSLERQSEQTEWRRGEELRKREERLRELQLELDRERGKEPVVKAGLLSSSPETPYRFTAGIFLYFLVIGVLS